MSRNASEEFGAKAMWFESVDMLIDALRATVTSDVNLLVKGSRFMRMERVVQALDASGALSGEA
jgi:UDP-N-acetylmuramoyl-tripeptide--D-alanyl-D-alanine ligase